MMKSLWCYVIMAALVCAGAVGGPFRIAVLPDTQYYSKSYPEIFETQTQWIVNNLDTYNIRFVTHLGDLVNNNGDDPAQWLNANAAISILDGDPALYPEKHVPYSICLGNHDLTVASDKYSGFGEYLYFFGSHRFAECSWYGGSSRNGASHYQIFQADGRQWLHLNIDLFPDDETLKWAQDVLDMYPDLPAIYSTHAYISDLEDPNTLLPTYSSASFNTIASNGGLGQWSKLIYNNDQIFLVLNGHHFSDDGQGLMISQNAWGRDVIQMCMDYQGHANGGNGWMNLLELDPAHNQINVQTYSPYLNQYMVGSRFDPNNATDVPSIQFSIPLDFSERLSDFNRREQIPTVQAANVEVIQLSPGNEPQEIIAYIPTGQKTPMIDIHDPNDVIGQSNRGDYVVRIGDELRDDVLNGIHIASIAENGRQNGNQLNFHTPAIGYGQTNAWLAVHTTSLSYAGYSGGDEDNVNMGATYFPFSGGWVGGRVLNLNNNGDLWVHHGSGHVVMNETLTPAAGRPRPYGGGNFAAGAKGVWELRIPGVDSLRDGVLMVCGGKNEDNYACASPHFDGTSWFVGVHDNGVNGGSWEQDPFNYVYIPYETPGIAAGVIYGSGGILNGTDNFTIQYVSTGTYRLSIDNHSPQTGTLLVCSGPGSYSDDNIVTYEPDGNDWIIMVRDLPITNGTTYNPQTNPWEAFTFAFIPFDNPPAAPGPNRVWNEYGISAGDFTVVNIAPTALGGIYPQNRRNYMTAYNYDTGDYALARNGYQLAIEDGILMATSRQTLRTMDQESYIPTVSTDRRIKDGGQGVVVHRVASATLEGDADFAAAWFPFGAGFAGGHIDTNYTAASFAGPAPTVTMGSSGLPGTYTISLGSVNPRDGLLFVVAQNSENNTVASAAPSADGVGWDVVTRTNAQAFGYTAERFGYLYLPYHSDKVLIGHLGADGSVLKSNSTVAASRENAGIYRLSIPNAGPDKGMLVLNSCGRSMNDPACFAVSYAADNGDFVITCTNLSGTPQTADTEVAFAYVPFEEDWAFPFVTDESFDFEEWTAFSKAWLTSTGQAAFDARWDFNDNGSIGLEDLLVFTSHWLR
jgi:hypothetical protein